jgi:hypothetical protein
MDIPIYPQLLDQQFQRWRFVDQREKSRIERAFEDMGLIVAHPTSNHLMIAYALSGSEIEVDLISGVAYRFGCPVQPNFRQN